jgi:hypothetical protein
LLLFTESPEARVLSVAAVPLRQRYQTEPWRPGLATHIDWKEENRTRRSR